MHPNFKYSVTYKGIYLHWNIQLSYFPSELHLTVCHDNVMYKI